MIIYRAPIGNRRCMKTRCQVPPSPGLMAKLLERYNELIAQGAFPRN